MLYSRCFHIGLLLLGVFVTKVNAQGCSDAGVCSIQNYSFETDDNSSTKIRAGLTQTMELGEQQIVYLHTSSNVSLVRTKFSATLILPYRTAFYGGGIYNGLSDVALSLTYRIKNGWFITQGFKLPTNQANVHSASNQPLPMALQMSLGNYDMMTQIGLVLPEWRFAAGWQHPFGANKNEFVANEEFPGFATSYHLQRGDDVMLRGDREVKRMNGHWQFSLISVYRLHGDKTNGTLIPNSEGITLNVGISRLWEVKAHEEIVLSIATPLVAREVRPDGLTRNFIVAFSWSGLFTGGK